MAEEFHGGVCGGGNWWSSSRNLYGSSPCSLSTNDVGRSFGNNWPMNNHDLTIMMNTKATRSSDDSVSDGSSSSHHVVVQDVVRPHDEALQMLGISLSSSTNPDDWNQDLLHDSGRSEENYSNILQEAAALDSSMNYWQENEWISTANLSQESSVIVNSFKQVNQDFQQPLNSILSSTACQGLSNGNFPLDSVSYSYNSSLLETLFDETDSQPPQQQSLLENGRIDYLTAENYPVKSDEFLPSLPTASSMANPSFVEQLPSNNLPFNTNYNAPLWNDVRSSFLPSSQSMFLPSYLHSKKPNLHSAKHQNEEVKDSVAKKSSNEPAFKRPRIETPSPLPTFKVRKEKLGDRITALQQLVSPFGKTDTASVLHEAIEYIRFLHDQVNELSSPYLKQRSTPLQHLLAAEGQERVTQDLKSRGLCLVPVSSTFPVAQTPADFWRSPTFGGSFK